MRVEVRLEEATPISGGLVFFGTSEGVRLGSVNESRDTLFYGPVVEIPGGVEAVTGIAERRLWEPGTTAITAATGSSSSRQMAPFSDARNPNALI